MPMKRRTLLRAPLAALAVPAAAQWGPPPAPSFEAIHHRLRQWAQSHAKKMRLEEIGKSVEGRPLLRAWITDRAAPDRNKERVFMSALHAGQEQSGATGLLTVMQWLLESPLAAPILRRQTIVCMPVVNPDRYVHPNSMDGLMNMRRRDPYTGWTVDGPADAANCPEAVAVQRTIDELQAEVHTDLHGNSMPFPGVYQVESSGRAYSNLSLRPYHHEIIRQMDAAAQAEGYPSDQAEEDAERIFGGSELGMPAEKVWSGIRSSAGGGESAAKPRVYAAIYGYNRYHTLLLASEAGWERSALLRQKRLLEIGNEVWPGEYYPGYPVRVITKTVNDALIVAYGTDAEERRRSRVELWNRQRQIVHGTNRPSAVGRLVYACATSPAAVEKWLKDRTLTGFAAHMRQHPAMHHDRIARLLTGFPDFEGQWGPTSNMSMAGTGVKPQEWKPIQHGLAVRLRLPFPKARSLEVWMNGERLAKSERSGMATWAARGFTYVQANISPERSRKEDFFVITCEYDPGEKRSTGLPWTAG
jgi:hypothetical protein